MTEPDWEEIEDRDGPTLAYLEYLEEERAAMTRLYSTHFYPGEPIRKDDACCSPGVQTVEDYLQIHFPDAVETSSPEWPQGVRYFICKNVWDHDYIRAIWIE